MEARDVFRAIYATDEWKGGSGEGSTIEATAPYRHVLEVVVGARDVRSVTDIGCGDWQFSRFVDWHDKPYIGVDVVPELVEHNRMHAPSGAQFLCADARTVDVPRADLLVMKDVLQHWPIADIGRFFEQNRYRFRYLLLTNDVASVHCPSDLLNSECELGAWRTIDLEQSPFGYRAAWRRDFDIRGEWTKRIVLFVAPSYRVRSWLPGSALRRLRKYERRVTT